MRRGEGIGGDERTGKGRTTQERLGGGRGQKGRGVKQLKGGREGRKGKGGMNHERGREKWEREERGGKSASSWAKTL